jgi:gluconate kinase
MKKTIFILFGEMGCGKTFYGRQMATNRSQTGFHTRFWDADEAATQDMIDCIDEFKPMNRDMISRYVNILKTSIVRKAEEASSDLIISQALYMDEHRQQIIDHLELLGYTVHPYWVRCSLLTNAKRLLSRERGRGWLFYWLMNKPFFQRPKHFHTIINND